MAAEQSTSSCLCYVYDVKLRVCRDFKGALSTIFAGKLNSEKIQISIEQDSLINGSLYPKDVDVNMTNLNGK